MPDISFVQSLRCFALLQSKDLEHVQRLYIMYMSLYILVLISKCSRRGVSICLLTLNLKVHKDPWVQNKQYYPIPPKKYVPNKDKRDDSKCIRGQMTIGERAAVATRNVERDQWDTTYDRQYTGLGPANPNKLDNYLS